MTIDKGKTEGVAQVNEELTDEDYQKLQQEILDEENGVKPEKKPEEETKPENKPEEEGEEQDTPEEGADEEQEKQTEEDKQKESDRITAEHKRILEAKDEELSEEDKTVKADLIKAKEEAEKKEIEDRKKSEEELNTEIKAYASEHRISEKEAREDFESRDKILEKYKSDPKHLALSNLHLQRLYSQTQQELKTAQEARPLKIAENVSSETFVNLIDKGEIKINGKAIKRDEAITIYREKFPDISENLDDDAVIKLVGKELKEAYVKNEEGKLREISSKAQSRRTELLNSIPESDKKYLSQIQPLLEKYPDEAVISDSFDIQDLVYHFKGRNYDKDLKEFGEKEYRRGIEGAKIIAQKQTPNSTGSQKPKSKSKVILNDDQKKEALDMYDGTTFSEDEKYEAYAELVGITKK